MAVFFIADTHFDDAMIMNCESRPFADVKSMNEAIIANWNDTVEKDDEVFFVGDVGNPEYVSKLNGKKYLIKGNHDKLSNEEYRAVGFAEVYDYPIIYNDFWIVSHEPVYVNMNMPYANIFGHVHNSPLYKTVSARSYCVSLERLDYKPVLFEDIAAAVAVADEQEDKENNI